MEIGIEMHKDQKSGRFTCVLLRVHVLCDTKDAFYSGLKAYAPVFCRRAFTISSG